MIKQVESHGQCFELYSPDDGHTWSSTYQAIVAYGRRKKIVRCPMYFSCFLLVATFLTIAPVFSAKAQVNRTPTGETRVLELVDQLKEVIRKAEKSRTDPALMQQLRDLVRRYDYPWRVALLYDDFRDGDYTANPAWVVDKGDFRVSQFGLGTVFTPPVSPTTRRSPEKSEVKSALEIFGGIIGGMTRQEEAVPQTAQPSTAEIYTELRISNPFAVKLQMTSRGRSADGARLEFGPYQGSGRNQGYRLVYTPGNKPAFALLRVAAGRSSVIEVYDPSVNLEDGRSHNVEWRRGTEGEMVVLLDDKEIIRTSDRASGESFDGFTVINGGGDYSFSQIAIFGTTQ
jgi:hypothetical protein